LGSASTTGATFSFSWSSSHVITNYSSGILVLAGFVVSSPAYVLSYMLSGQSFSATGHSVYIGIDGAISSIISLDFISMIISTKFNNVISI
jgi:hypothetical protein